ncbi:Phosphate-specific transport system accessory protein PhoU [archaeon HR01]|nr:Phosphate-specific transport system accessory protein PhoU [archaeon HR01]
MIYRLVRLNIFLQHIYIPVKNNNGVQETYTRRVQKTGRSTFIISLPKEWVEKTSLKKLDTVKIVTLPFGLLVTTDGHEQGRESVIRLSGNETPDEVVRLFFSKYLDGSDRIRVELSSYLPQAISVLKDRIRRWLVGVEIIGETATELTAQVLPVSDKLPLHTSLERMGEITSHMLVEAMTAFSRNDKALAEDVVRRDDEVDRFYHFITRQLNIAVRDYAKLRNINLSDPSDCISYVLVAKSIERAADHAVTISNITLSTTNNSKPDQRIIKINAKVAELFDTSLASFLYPSTELANKTLSQIAAISSEMNAYLNSQKKYLDLERRLTELVVINSVRRVAEYAADISEAAINLATKDSFSK